MLCKTSHASAREALRGMLGVAALALAVAAGCGSPAEQTSVTGVVTFDGKPLPQGVVAFLPAEAAAGGYPFLAEIQPDGRFTVPRDAQSLLAMRGRYTVIITAWVPSPETDTGATPRGRSLIPERYGDHAASGLEATIHAGAKHELAFDLVK
jgi:hypothetical protein